MFIDQIKNTDLKNYRISTVFLPDFKKYETMVFCKKINDEIECKRSETRFNALNLHRDFVKQFAENKEAVKIGEILKAANLEAQKFINEPDGGTCNFDAPVIYLKGKRSNFIDQIEAAAGLELSKLSGKYWGGFYTVLINSSGQAARRTKMAETAANYMKKAGLETAVYYAMD